MWGNFGLFRSFSPKWPPTTLNYIVMQLRKDNREKGNFPRNSSGLSVFQAFNVVWIYISAAI